MGGLFYWDTCLWYVLYYFVLSMLSKINSRLMMLLDPPRILLEIQMAQAFREAEKTLSFSNSGGRCTTRYLGSYLNRYNADHIEEKLLYAETE